MNHCIICNLRYLMTLTQMGVDILVNNIYAYLFLKCHHYIYVSCINWQYVLSMQILLFRPTIKKYPCFRFITFLIWIGMQGHFCFLFRFFMGLQE